MLSMGFLYNQAMIDIRSTGTEIKCLHCIYIYIYIYIYYIYIYIYIHIVVEGRVSVVSFKVFATF